MTTVALTACLTAKAQTPAQPAQAHSQLQDVQITEGPRIEHVDAHQAIIAWSTNVSAGTIVRYGTNRTQLDRKAEMPWGGLTHRVTLAGLKPATGYFFVAESNQGQDTGTAASQRGEFHTPPDPATGAAPAQGGGEAGAQMQAGPVVQNVTDRSASIWWNTNAPTAATLRYGTDPRKLTHVQRNDQAEQSHQVIMKDLQPATMYYVAVLGPDGLPRAAAQFKTMSDQAMGKGKLRITNGPVVEYLSDKLATIAWSTNQRSSTVVRYGADANILSHSVQGNPSEGTHRVEIKNLKPSSTYYFVAESQGTSTVARSVPAPIKTTAPGQTPVRISVQQ